MSNTSLLPLDPGDKERVVGAEARFRAVMMTSFAFILGLVPLVIATGAGALSRKAVGTAVFGGMLFAAFFGIFLIPTLYVVFQAMRERLHGLFERKKEEPPPPAEHGEAEAHPS